MYFLLIQTVEIFILLALALLCDIKTYKIKNLITLPITVLGFVTNITVFGFEGLKSSILGWCIPVALLFFLFMQKMLGAGDIKLFGAIGAIMGCEFAVYSILYSFVFGGFIGMGFLFARRNAADRFKYFFNYVKSCMLTYSFLQYGDFKSGQKMDGFCFSYAVVPGTMLQMMLFYLNS